MGEKNLLRFSAPGPEGREENKILPKGWKIRKKGSQDLQLDGENKAKILSKKSKEEILIDLEEQRKHWLLTKPQRLLWRSKRHQSMKNGRMVTTCLLDGGAEDKLASVHTKGMVEEKQDSPSMLNGMMVTTCLRDGEAEDNLASVYTKRMVEEK